MTLQLELSPAEAQELKTLASREGKPVDIHAHHLLAAALRQKMLLQLHDYDFSRVVNDLGK